MLDTDSLRHSAKLLTSDELNQAADEIEALRELAIWMTGCGYDFTQHKHWIKSRDTLLKHSATV